MQLNATVNMIMKNVKNAKLNTNIEYENYEF